MTPEQGKIIYDHLCAAKPQQVLELGTACGVSAAYMAAALDENGFGHITTVDRADLSAGFDPKPEDVLERVGVRQFVTILRPDDSSYNWFLKNEVAARSDSAGNCRPIYDFCYLDGAHNFTVDGLAVVLIEKLLNPGSWLLVDDLDWTYAEGDVGEDLRLSDAEIREPHMAAVYDLIVKQHPAFTEFRVQDGWWGWARKAPGEPRRYTLETTRSISAIVVDRLRKLRRRVRQFH